MSVFRRWAVGDGLAGFPCILMMDRKSAEMNLNVWYLIWVYKKSTKRRGKVWYWGGLLSGCFESNRGDSSTNRLIDERTEDFSGTVDNRCILGISQLILDNTEKK